MAFSKKWIPWRSVYASFAVFLYHLCSQYSTMCDIISLVRPPRWWTVIIWRHICANFKETHILMYSNQESVEFTFIISCAVDTFIAFILSAHSYGLALSYISKVYRSPHQRASIQGPVVPAGSIFLCHCFCYNRIGIHLYGVAYHSSFNFHF